MVEVWAAALDAYPSFDYGLKLLISDSDWYHCTVVHRFNMLFFSLWWHNVDVKLNDKSFWTNDLVFIGNNLLLLLEKFYCKSTIVKEDYIKITSILFYDIFLL